MKKILIFHQPFPMGNYKLNEVIASKLKQDGNDVYLLEQLNGIPPDREYLQQLRELKPDIVYFEMLDEHTFYVIQSCFKTSLKILCYTSGGIYKTPDQILPFHKKFYDKIITNSKMCQQLFQKNGIECEHFKYYFSIYSDNELRSDKYLHDCAFLGMGFNRLSSNDYELERRIFFEPIEPSKFNFAIYGNGWANHLNAKGVLPPTDIYQLYSNSKTAIAIIGKGQREMGMINNRYTEIIMAECPLITYPYPEIDWYGLENHLHFVNSRTEFLERLLYLCRLWKGDIDQYNEYTKQARFYFENAFKTEFYLKLNKLIYV